MGAQGVFFAGLDLGLWDLRLGSSGKRKERLGRSRREHPFITPDKPAGRNLG